LNPLACAGGYALLYETGTMLNNEIYGDLKDCVTLIGVNESEQYRKLAVTLLSRGAKLSGLGIPVAIAEMIDAIKDIAETKGVQHESERKAAKFLLEIELFMMLSLPAALFATAAVRIRTANDNDGEKSDATSEINEAREYVKKHLLKFRGLFENADAKPLLRFPQNGMWMEELDP
jgi:hypothetical protein